VEKRIIKFHRIGRTGFKLQENIGKYILSKLSNTGMWTDRIVKSFNTDKDIRHPESFHRLGTARHVMLGTEDQGPYHGQVL